jgi:NAD(P)-dependent dehydrogenase (short-subunit alcohol dehydrogenase family)
MRSVAGHYKDVDGIRINAVLPGATRTPIVPDSAWEAFPQEFFTPVELVAKVVLMLADGVEMVDAKGVRVPAGKTYGQAVVATGNDFFVMDQPEYCDATVAGAIEATRR